MTRRDRDRELFSRWCRATGRNPGAVAEADVEEFFRQVPARGSTVRLRRSAVFPRPVMPVCRPRTVPAVPAIAAATTSPVRSVRDHLILVLLADGLTAQQVASFGARGAADRNRCSATEGSAVVCPACAVAAWRLVAGPLLLGHRSAARSAANAACARLRAGEHLCVGPVDVDVELGVRLPPIDRHGWAGRAMLSTRSIARVVAAHRDDAPAPPVQPRPLGSPVARAELDNDLAATEASMQELEARIAALQAQLGDLSAGIARYR